MEIKILPSLLAADMGYLADGAKRAEEAGADGLHIDIMDPHFVPNISMGPAVVEMARRVVKIPLSVHLMLSRPDQMIQSFVDAGSDSLLIHVEAECNIKEELLRIRELGVRPGITINPETPAEMLFTLIDCVDEVLCMTVHPGYGGQSFIADVLPKIRQLREFAQKRRSSDLDILVDGGIDMVSGPRCAACGANALIAGTSLYKARDMAADIAELRRKAAETLMSEIE